MITTSPIPAAGAKQTVKSRPILGLYLPDYKKYVTKSQNASAYDNGTSNTIVLVVISMGLVPKWPRKGDLGASNRHRANRN